MTRSHQLKILSLPFLRGLVLSFSSFFIPTGLLFFNKNKKECQTKKKRGEYIIANYTICFQSTDTYF